MTDAQNRRKEEESLLFGLLNLMARDTNHRLREMAQQYLNGTDNVATLSQALVTALRDAHSHAAYLGRRLAGKRQPFGYIDQVFGMSVVIAQQQYLSGLLTDLATGRYVKPDADPTMMAAALANRIKMYAVRLRGSANEAWVRNLPQETLVNWTLHPAEHCEDCLQRAAGSPYNANTIPWTPGDGSSICGVHDQCTLDAVGGGSGFPPLEI